MKSFRGQLTIYNFKKEVRIMGICDDAYCPECRYAFWDNEVDRPECPECGLPVDWKPWHRINDVESEDEI